MLYTRNTTVNILFRIETDNKQVNNKYIQTTSVLGGNRKGVLGDNARVGRGSLLVRILKGSSSGKLVFKLF